MIAYCISENLFDHAKDETGYFKQLLRDYRDKLILCITKCPRTDSNLYFNIRNDICDAIGADACCGAGETDVLQILIFDAKDYIKGRKNNDEGLINTSSFEYFLDCINRFSECETYVSRCTTRLRQMQSCLSEILEAIPCLSQEDRELSEEEAAELNRIEAIRQRAYASTKDLHQCETKIMRDMRKTLRQDGAIESISQLEKDAHIKLEKAVGSVLGKIRTILAEMEIYVRIDSPDVEELKIDGSVTTNKPKNGTPRKNAGEIMTQVGDATTEGVKNAAAIVKQKTSKRWWQFWIKPPEISGLDQCVLFLEKHQAAMQGIFAAVGIGIDLIQEIRGEQNEKKRRAAIERILQDFDANIRQIIRKIIEDIQKSIDQNCQMAQDTIHNRIAVKLGHDTPEDQARRVALDLQSCIRRIQEEVQNGGRV